MPFFSPSSSMEGPLPREGGEFQSNEDLLPLALQHRPPPIGQSELEGSDSESDSEALKRGWEIEKNDIFRRNDKPLGDEMLALMCSGRIQGWEPDDDDFAGHFPGETEEDFDERQDIKAFKPVLCAYTIKEMLLKAGAPRKRSVGNTTGRNASPAFGFGRYNSAHNNNIQSKSTPEDEGLSEDLKEAVERLHCVDLDFRIRGKDQAMRFGNVVPTSIFSFKNMKAFPNASSSLAGTYFGWSYWFKIKGVFKSDSDGRKHLDINFLFPKPTNLDAAGFTRKALLSGRLPARERTRRRPPPQQGGGASATTTAQRRRSKSRARSKSRNRNADLRKKVAAVDSVDLAKKGESQMREWLERKNARKMKRWGRPSAYKTLPAHEVSQDQDTQIEADRLITRIVKNQNTTRGTPRGATGRGYTHNYLNYVNAQQQQQQQKQLSDSRAGGADKKPKRTLGKSPRRDQNHQNQNAAGKNRSSHHQATTSTTTTPTTTTTTTSTTTAKSGDQQQQHPRPPKGKRKNRFTTGARVRSGSMVRGQRRKHRSNTSSSNRSSSSNGSSNGGGGGSGRSSSRRAADTQGDVYYKAIIPRAISMGVGHNENSSYNNSNCLAGGEGGPAAAAARGCNVEAKGRSSTPPYNHPFHLKTDSTATNSDTNGIATEAAAAAAASEMPKSGRVASLNFNSIPKWDNYNFVAGGGGSASQKHLHEQNTPSSGGRVKQKYQQHQQHRSATLAAARKPYTRLKDQPAGGKSAATATATTTGTCTPRGRPSSLSSSSSEMYAYASKGGGPPSGRKHQQQQAPINHHYNHRQYLHHHHSPMKTKYQQHSGKFPSLTGGHSAKSSIAHVLIGRQLTSAVDRMGQSSMGLSSKKLASSDNGHSASTSRLFRGAKSTSTAKLRFLPKSRTDSTGGRSKARLEKRQQELYNALFRDKT
mmetsp:Transcript_31776/g.51622  ORF Transcript_31776/g.51622 Transcript_31776/m.51622 type:complete len:928 (+) Transcript_31776:110-2893(+)